MAAGGLPLWLLMLRRARREHRPRDTAYLLLPIAAPVVYWVILAVTVRLVPHAHGVSPWWFLAFTVLGFAAAAAAAAAAAGPGLALRRLRPRGPAVRLAASAAALAVLAIDLAAVASGVAAIGLHRLAPGFAAHDGASLDVYLGLVTVAAAVATVSAARGTRAALAERAR